MTEYNPFEGYTVPEAIRKRVLTILKRYTINGICDGMYIANVIAHRTGCGNGEGEFFSTPAFTQEECDILASDIQGAYGCNIFKCDIKELTEILKTGSLDKAVAVNGIQQFVKRLKVENLTCDEWRKDYNNKQIKTALKTFHELSEVGEQRF